MEKARNVSERRELLEAYQGTARKTKAIFSDIRKYMIPGKMYEIITIDEARREAGRPFPRVKARLRMEERYAYHALLRYENGMALSLHWHELAIMHQQGNLRRVEDHYE